MCVCVVREWGLERIFEEKYSKLAPISVSQLISKDNVRDMDGVILFR